MERQILSHSNIIQSMRLKVREWLHKRGKSGGYSDRVAMPLFSDDPTRVNLPMRSVVRQNEPGNLKWVVQWMRG